MNDNDYCTCKEPYPITTELDVWGYWDVCTNCGKRIEGSYVGYNHYDGEDHDVSYDEH